MKTVKMEIVFNHFLRLAREVPHKAAEITDQFAFLVFRESQRQIQVMRAIDTGAMLNSGYVATSRHSTYAQAVSSARSTRPQARILGEVRPTRVAEAMIAYAVGYAMPVHWGSGRRSGRPFLLKAVEMYRYPYLNALKKVMQP